MPPRTRLLSVTNWMRRRPHSRRRLVTECRRTIRLLRHRCTSPITPRGRPDQDTTGRRRHHDPRPATTSPVRRWVAAVAGGSSRTGCRRRSRSAPRLRRTGLPAARRSPSRGPPRSRQRGPSRRASTTRPHTPAGSAVPQRLARAPARPRAIRTGRGSPTRSARRAGPATAAARRGSSRPARWACWSGPRTGTARSVTTSPRTSATTSATGSASARTCRSTRTTTTSPAGTAAPPARAGAGARAGCARSAGSAR